MTDFVPAPVTDGRMLTACPPRAGGTESPIRVAGIAMDHHGWIAVELCDQRFHRAVHAGTLLGVISRLCSPAAITVAAPLGLPVDRRRAADTATAALLGSRSHTTPPAPPAAALAEATHTAATKRCRQLTGVSVTTKAWSARARILEAHAVWSRHTRLLNEAHADLTYAYLTGSPPGSSPTSWGGQSARRRLLASHGITVPDDLAAVEQATAVRVLDAATVAYTGHRIATGAAVCHPDPPEQIDGSLVAIWT
jgi:predicted RNase H-like nuclease